MRIQFLLVLAAALAAMGATAPGVDVQFEWAPCPRVGEFGLGMGEAVQYRIWRSTNGGPEELAAVTGDTLFALSVQPGTTVKIRVQGVDAAGTASVKSEWSDPLYYETDGRGVPRPAYLKPNYPNPFNPETTLSYLVPEGLGAGERLSLEIFSVRGQKVRTLPVERAAGWHQVLWDGQDDRGRAAASGMYVSRLVAGAVVETGKLTMLK